MESILNCLNTTSISILSPLIILCLFLLLFRSSKVGNSREPPKVAGAWPILGHLPLLMSGSKPLHIKLGALAEKYGPIFTIELGAAKSTLVLISNWEMARECFTTNDIFVSSRPKLVAVEHLSYNLAMFGFAPYGPYWRELRKIVTLELLSNRRIELLSQVRVSEVEASIKELFNLWSNSRKNESGYALVEMKQWFSELTFNMVLKVIAGKRFFGATVDMANEEKAKRFLETTGEFLPLLGFTLGDVVPSLRWLDFGGHEKRMKGVAHELDEILTEWLEEHRQQIVTLDEKDDARNKDFIDVLLSLLDDRKIEGFDSDTIIKATTLAMIVGATDSPSVTLTWAICLLLRNPHVLEKAKEELDTQIGKEECVTESSISKLVYLQAIVKETLRLYPPAPLASHRIITEDCTLGGYQVKKGTQLITNLWKIQTDPSVWSDPMEFKPERFITTHKDVDVRGQHFELLPFGSGRRMCPGISFGLQMVNFTLASFLHSFEIMNPSAQPVDMTGTLGLAHAKATPLEILLKPRLSLNCYSQTV